MSGLFQNVLRASVYGAVIIAAVVLLRLALRKAPKKYVCLLWVLAGLRLLCPVEIESSFSLQPDMARLSEVRTEAPVQIDWEQYTPAVPENAPMPEDVEVVYGDAFQPGAVTMAEEPKQIVIDYTAAAAWVWLAVACCMGLYSVFSYLGLKRRVREAVRDPDGVWECPGLETAFILGFLRPRIYLPSGLSGESRAFILAHERAHLKRGDHWVKLLGFIALAVHWFNPLVWVAYILLCRDIEMACDESVVRGMDLDRRKAYSAALLRCSSGHRSIAACPVAFGEVSVRQRIISVLNYRRPRFWLTLLAVAAIVFVAVCFLTSPEENDETHAEWEDQCRAVLEEIQSKDYYYILEDRAIEGENALNDGVCRSHFGVGEDWLLIDYHDDVDESQQYLAFLGVGGTYYDSVSSELEFDWRETDPRTVAVVVPWLYSFDMDAQETDAISCQTTEEGYVIRLKVYGPSGLETIDADSYHVDFCFDQDGDFQCAVQYVYESEDESIITTMYAPEATEGRVLSTMSRYAGEIAQREPGISLGTATVEAEEPLSVYLGGEQTAEPETAEAPDWAITMAADNVTPRGLSLHITQEKMLARQELYYGKDFSLDRWNGSGWEPVEPIIDNGAFSLAAIQLPQNETTLLNINWAWLYGELSPGTYRIGKSISNMVQPQIGVSISMEDQPEETNYTYYTVFEVTAEEESRTEEEKLVQKCRDLLAAFQSQESYSLAIQWTFTGDVLNDNCTQYFYRSGADWLRIASVEGADQSMKECYLEKDGIQYSGLAVTIHDPANGESTDSGWQEGALEEWEVFEPWPRSFDWDAQEVTLLSSRSDAEGEQISFQVQGSPYARDEGLDITEYQVTFIFPGDEKPDRIVLTYTMQGGDIQDTGEMIFLATAPDGIESLIDTMYAEAKAGKPIK